MFLRNFNLLLTILFFKSDTLTSTPLFFVGSLYVKRFVFALKNQSLCNLNHISIPRRFSCLQKVSGKAIQSVGIAFALTVFVQFNHCFNRFVTRGIVLSKQLCVWAFFSWFLHSIDPITPCNIDRFVFLMWFNEQNYRRIAKYGCYTLINRLFSFWSVYTIFTDNCSFSGRFFWFSGRSTFYSNLRNLYLAWSVLPALWIVDVLLFLVLCVQTRHQFWKQLVYIQTLMQFVMIITSCFFKGRLFHRILFYGLSKLQSQQKILLIIKISNKSEIILVFIANNNKEVSILPRNRSEQVAFPVFFKFL